MMNAPRRSSEPVTLAGDFQPERHDPGLFRIQTLRCFADAYRDEIERAVEVLDSVDFSFERLRLAHRLELNRELLFRHALPFCLMESSSFPKQPPQYRYLAALLLGHTLSLTHLDYHLDGSSPEDGVASAAVSLEPHLATAYSVRCLFAAMRIVEDLPSGDRLAREVFDPISGFVVERMLEDFEERYDESQLRNGSTALDGYLKEPSSRLMGSGYWEVMARGAFIAHESTTPTDVILIIGQLRKLRQIVDEAVDIEEDLAAGLLTLPLRIALSSNDPQDRLVEMVKSLWMLEQRSRRVAASEAAQTIKSILIELGCLDRTFEIAEEIWRNGKSLCEQSDNAAAKALRSLLDIKRAKLHLARRNGWQSPVTPSVYLPP